MSVWQGLAWLSLAGLAEIPCASMEFLLLALSIIKVLFFLKSFSSNHRKLGPGPMGPHAHAPFQGLTMDTHITGTVFDEFTKEA